MSHTRIRRQPQLIITTFLFRDEPKQKDVKKPSNDLLDLDFGHPQISHQPPPPTRTAASGPAQLDPWGVPKQQQTHHQQITAANNDPWGGHSTAMTMGGSMGENSASNVRLPSNSDPWSPVQHQNLSSGATGAIPRTSPGIGLDTSGKGPDLHRLPAGMYS